MSTTTLKIGNHIIGPQDPCLIVAELSANHRQDKSIAFELINAAAHAQVDAIKLQTYTPDTMTLNSNKPYFQIHGTGLWDNKTLYQLYADAYTPWEWHQELKTYAESKGLIFFSTPFDETAVDFLESLNVLLYKVASFEAVDVPLLKKIAQTHKPVIASRGLANFEDIQLMKKTLFDNGTTALALLHCVSSYPATAKQMNLAHIQHIQNDFRVLSGLSDHTLGTEAATLAVLLGAHIIEKHITLNRNDGGPDAAFSLEPNEMKQLVTEIRAVEQLSVKQKQSLIEKMPNAQTMIGKADYKIGEKEARNSQFRRSIWVKKSVEKGEVFSKNNIGCFRPTYGLEPKYFEDILGKRATRDIEFAEPLNWSMVKK